jgi:mutator protein MutT
MGMASILDFLTDAKLRVLATPATVNAGREITKDGEISFGVFRPDRIEAQVARFGLNTRHVELAIENGALQWDCSCTKSGKFCKHAVAAALAAQKEGRGDIHKAAGIIIQRGKLLHEKSMGKPAYIAPGGRIEEGESPKQALIRELKEELSITVKEADLEPFDMFTAEAANHPGQIVHMQVYTVKKWQGDIKAANEVEKLLWLDSTIPAGISVGSICEHRIIPRLKQLGLIT